jgi:hypothetical protein
MVNTHTRMFLLFSNYLLTEFDRVEEPLFDFLPMLNSAIRIDILRSFSRNNTRWMNRVLVVPTQYEQGWPVSCLPL